MKFKKKLKRDLVCFLQCHMQSVLFLADIFPGDKDEKSKGMNIGKKIFEKTESNRK